VTTQLVRVIGTAMARVAEAAGSAFLNVEGDLTAAGSDELALARATLRAVGLLPGTVRAMEVLLRRHLTAFIGVAMGLRDEPVVDLAVAFADLVGFTAFSQQLSPAELSRAVARFEAEASDTIAGEGGRLVKLIGDEAMVVAADADTACRVALALVGRFSDHEVLPPVRVGLATGPVLPQDGDYFGQPVNLASRLATLARPGTVLVGGGIKQAVAANPAYHLRAVGRRRLKGFDAPVPTWALRPAARRGT
jgi:adenylate cyclase